jgi:hypothetical protein
MARPRDIEPKEQTTFYYTDKTIRCIGVIFGNSKSVGLPRCSDRSAAIRLAVEELAHLIQYEEKNPGAIPFKSKVG